MFMEAIQINPSDWPVFLDTNCDSPELKEKVKSLLDAHVGSGDFMAETVMEAYPALTFPFGGEVEEFKIIRLIGKGGMGRVYLAEDTVLKRLVALKVVQHEDATGTANDEVISRFRKEARAAARLVHPGIVQIYRTGEREGFSYIAMEYVEGENLSEKLNSHTENVINEPSRRFRNIALLAAQIADAIEHAHRAGVIHRDIKPSNILIDQTGKARLADFGVARILNEDTLIQTGSIVGSCAYMSPEQARVCDIDVDHRSDVFSLGVVLYEAVSLQRPFQGDNFNDLMKALSDCNPKPLKRVCPNVPFDLSVICHKAIEKDVINRYQSAAHFYADLRCFAEGRPILARPPGLRRRIRDGLRKHLSYVVAAIFLVLTTALLATLWMMESQRRAQMGRISVSDFHQGAFVTAKRFGDELAIEETIELGVAPITTYLKPGLYRIVIQDSDTYLEASSLIDKGSHDWIEVKTPRPELIRELIEIPEGPYQLGTDKAKKSLNRRRTPTLTAFRISPTEVSNREYREFVNATGARAPTTWPTPYDNSFDNLPVSDVSWDEANSYCRWRGVRLPTPDEWEAASLGPDGAKFPWGNHPHKDIQRKEAPFMDPTAYQRFASPVDFDQLATPRNVKHMNSNVQEYTEGIASSRNRGQILKGRSWASSPFLEPSHLVVLSSRSVRSPSIGFRVALSKPTNERQIYED